MITDAVSMLARALQIELRRIILKLFVSVIALVLLLLSAIVFIIVGIIRLSDALGRVCGQWFGNVEIGDIVVGLVFMVIPLVGILLLHLRAQR